jgi:hypothetical protein
VGGGEGRREQDGIYTWLKESSLLRMERDCGGRGRKERSK